jgi:hypothetical protein
VCEGSTDGTSVLVTITPLDEDDTMTQPADE